MNHGTVYFDHAAATPVDERVLEAMLPYFTDRFYNPSSPYSAAVQVRKEYEVAKQQIGQSIGVKGDEIIMTAGATESIAIMFNSIDGAVLTSEMEHDAVYNSAHAHVHTAVAPDKNGVITAESVAAAMTPEVTLVSIAYVNHELGTIQPLRSIAQVVEKERLRRKQNGETLPLIFHTDASQALNLLDCHVSRLGVDAMTLNAAKIYGPKQVGCLWVKPGVVLQPHIRGGGQELGVRSGTENVAGTIGFAKAVTRALKHRSAEHARLEQLRNAAKDMIERELSDTMFLGSAHAQLVSFLPVVFDGIDAERIVFMLEQRGVFVATGSACAASKHDDSRTLLAIGCHKSQRQGSIRLTFGSTNTPENVERGIAELIAAVKSEYRRIGRAL